MIKKYSLKVLQKAINLALSLDDTMPGKIAELDGKIIEIFIDTLGIKFFIEFKEGASSYWTIVMKSRIL